MNKSNKHLGSLITGACVIALSTIGYSGAAGSASESADRPGTVAARSAGVIHACAKKENGQLRMVEGPDDCHPSEDPVSWSAAGPQGVPGEAGPPGPAGQCSAPPRYEFVGYSKEYVKGVVGILKFNRLCQKSFPDSRICTTREVAETINVPVFTQPVQPSQAPRLGWVRPTIIAGSGSNIAFEAVVGKEDRTEDFTCDGWSIGTQGLMVTEDGQFFFGGCNQPAPVACCAPVAE